MLLPESLRGVSWITADELAFVRADPADIGRLAMDVWASAQVPVGIRLELVGDAEAVEIDYRCRSTDPGHRGDAAGTQFTAWRSGCELATAAADGAGGTVRLVLSGPPDDVITIYLPEGYQPRLLEVRAVNGELLPAPRRPTWIAYGDSITEGWNASGPPAAWPAIVARDHGLDLVNLGYAGAARGQIVTAEELATLEADVISIAYGTNCWTRVPFGVEQFQAGFEAFLEVVRQGHPATPIVVVSATLRPEAEDVPNRLGATLGDLRDATETSVETRIAAGDTRLNLVRGGPILAADDLADNVHPDDKGHRALALAIGPAVVAALGDKTAD